ncbi:terminase small subunit [Skermanella pratensis]|uniref:terminase small subunit n=1 Tax=Skermanella pratensis TaxID=2233999 RepID=UPI0013011927|nr:terminase small subunit [Skermanella pratensis]
MTAPVPRLAVRQELFCEEIAAGSSAAEAARRAGYSPHGAKQRGHFLLGQEEVRMRIDTLRAERRAFHRSRLDRAAEVLDTVIADALEARKPGIVLRAVELQIKLLGIVQDRRISHHFHGEGSGSDAGAYDAAPDPREWLDGIPPKLVVPAAETVPAEPAPATEAGPQPGDAVQIVTEDDLSAASGSDPAAASPGMTEPLPAGLPPKLPKDLPAGLWDKMPDDFARLPLAEPVPGRPELADLLAA